MTMNRRRFLSISAACAIASPAQSQVHRWQGKALGAEAQITLHAPADIAVPALENAQALLDQVARQFNLFDARSALSTLNKTGRLHAPAPMFRQLLQTATQVHEATGGLFDPTVQPLWRALAEGGDTQAARELIGWSQVRHDTSSVVLGRGQALTFNGIAQGFATDLVAEALQAAGLTQTLVNIGEFRGIGGPWTLGISDPALGHIGTRTITSSAVATSSPYAVPLVGHGHILHGSAKPHWSTVSVEADQAVMADAFSTALTLAPLGLAQRLKGRFGIRRITLINTEGEIRTV